MVSDPLEALALELGEPDAVGGVRHVEVENRLRLAGQLAALLDRAGDRKHSSALLETLGAGEAYGASTGLAIFHAISGDPEKAAEWAGTFTVKGTAVIDGAEVVREGRTLRDESARR